MTLMAAVLTFFGVCLASALLTWLMMQVGITDMPNARSSHARPTPKSGGVAIALACLGGLAAILFFFLAGVPDLGISLRTYVLFIFLSVLVTAVALIDDIWDVVPFSKLLAQIVAALVFVFLIGRIEVIEIPGIGLLPLGAWGYALSALWIVFFMNAFNFMDGINGIAGGCALVAALILGWIAFHQGADFVAFTCLALAASVAGFLPFNFPGGRIFMGDTGSQFIGFVFAALAVIGNAGAAGSPAAGRLSIILVPVLFSAFIYDVVLTLVYRALRRQNLMQAHREHLYQIGIRLGASHAQVTMVYVGLFALSGVAAWFVQTGTAADRFLICLLLFVGYSILAVLVYRAGLEAGVVVPLGADRARGAKGREDV